MGMAHCGGQGVGTVIWLRVMIERQKNARHSSDLMLVCGTSTGYSFFDLHRSVLPYRAPAARTGDQGRSPRVGGCDGALGVLAKENLLDGYLRRVIAVYHLPDFFIN
jgi:hypothetical protein